MTRKKVALVSTLLAALSYAAVAASPLPRAIGRENPELASVFRPPVFNLSAEYEDGEVLGFEIGLDRDALRKAIISKYSEESVLVTTCGGSSYEPISSRKLIRPFEAGAATDVFARGVVCLWVPERRISLIFYILANEVNRIDLALINVELV